MKPGKVAAGAAAMAALTGTDQLIKWFVVKGLKGKENVELIPDVLELEYYENFGAAFSSFMGMRQLLIVFTGLLSIFLIWKWLCLPEEKRFWGLHVGLMLVIGGALGNLADRVARGYVVDFIYFVPVDFPKFNFADICVVCGTALIFVLVMFYKEEELAKSRLLHLP